VDRPAASSGNLLRSEISGRKQMHGVTSKELCGAPNAICFSFFHCLSNGFTEVFEPSQFPINTLSNPQSQSLYSMNSNKTSSPCLRHHNTRYSFQSTRPRECIQQPTSLVQCLKPLLLAVAQISPWMLVPHQMLQGSGGRRVGSPDRCREP